MNKSNLFSDKTIISISVVKLHNQKINKTIFNQLLYRSPFDRVFRVKDNVKILGFVNNKEKYILWGDGISLYKCNLVRIIKFARFDLVNGKAKDFFDLYSNNDIEYFKDDAYERRPDIESMEKGPISYVLNAAEKDEILKKKDFIETFLHDLEQRQVFL